MEYSDCEKTVRSLLRNSLAIFTTLVAVGAATAAPAAAQPVGARGLLDSCAALRAVLPGAPDGNYILAGNRYLLGVYCHDMAGTPREYLNLSNTGASANFSQYTAGGAAPGTNVRSSFTKLRVNPKTLEVDINDLTFAASSGSLTHGSETVRSLPYGVGMACAGNGTSGIGNVDLRGTAFALNSGFQPGGFQPFGTATVSPDGQVAALSGGGYCGWIAGPGAYNPFNPTGANYSLKLKCTWDGVFRPQPCLDLGLGLS
ncbi:GON domain-containing protein [Actinokineospora auranticolor]|uniref:GON domain-containing protein n=1 Tax=Actinokineospora auranticolor TaxID=155976 RepID=A0A2S6H1D4_9PSEU|nr:GON domain-containing protein [Actinokineospora auranticolor]